MMLRIVEDLAEIDAAQWESLRQRSSRRQSLPRLCLFARLQDSGCASPGTGWRTQFLTLWRDDVLIGALPLYLKSHSWGEFVFDWAWAEAYAGHGLRYYPKLVASVPFTPVTGARLLAESALVRAQLIAAALQYARDAGVSSLHCLFPPNRRRWKCRRRACCCARGCSCTGAIRAMPISPNTCAGMRRDKRKKIQQERRRVNDAGIRFEHLRGDADHSRSTGASSALLCAHAPAVQLAAGIQSGFLPAHRRGDAGAHSVDRGAAGRTARSPAH
jgi:uncharacterized protein